jgi:hypothetical protein
MPTEITSSKVQTTGCFEERVAKERTKIRGNKGSTITKIERILESAASF